MSFIKYAENPDVKEGNGRGPMHFGRAHVDGLPFRGKPVMLKEEEWDDFTEIVYDAQVELFDLSDDESKKRLQSVIDNVANGVFRVLRYDHHWYEKGDGIPSIRVYLMWCSAQRELAKYRLPAGFQPTPFGGGR
jgi:hypothetical protein